MRDNGIVRKNNTAAHPSCLYRGDDRQRNVFVALSTCRDTISADLVINNTHHNVQFIQRERRDAEMMESGEDVNQKIVVSVTQARVYIEEPKLPLILLL